MKALYIHIPFCKSKCIYCDFTSYPDQLDYIDKYLNTLENEMQYYKMRNHKTEILHCEAMPLVQNDDTKKMQMHHPEKRSLTSEASLFVRDDREARHPERRDLSRSEGSQFYTNEQIYSIFIGGGTPSILNIPQLDKLFKSINNNFDILDNAEITIEANPESLTLEKIKFLKTNTPVNRISLGLQAFDNKILKKTGRLHTFETFVQCYKNLKNAGFDNINIDLIVSWDFLSDNPNNYNKNFITDLDNFLNNFDIQHISVYMLSITKGTKLFDLCHSKQPSLSSSELCSGDP